MTDKAEAEAEWEEITKDTEDDKKASEYSTFG